MYNLIRYMLSDFLKSVCTLLQRFEFELFYVKNVATPRDIYLKNNCLLKTFHLNNKTRGEV